MRHILTFLLCILVSAAAGAASALLPNTDKQPVGFTGYIKDSESGLYYARARYYDPSIGRFMTEDPEAGRDMQPPSLHRYLYSYANPTTYVDPTGRQSFDAGGMEFLYMRMEQNKDLRERGVPVEQRAEFFAGMDSRRAVVGGAAAGLALLGTEWVVAARAAMAAYGTGGFVWGAHTFLMEGQGPFEATVSTFMETPVPSSLPLKSPAPPAALADEELASLAAQERAAVQPFDDVPLPTAPSPTPAMPTGPPQASVVAEGPGLSPAMAPMPVSAPARTLSMETGPYSVMKNRSDIPGQAHHLNQDSMYRDRIPHGDAVTVKLQGNAFSDTDSPHYLVHQAQEEFLNQFRRNGAREGELPTNLEMSRSIVDALQRAGYSRDQAMKLARDATRDRAAYNLLGGEPVPRLPGKINQKKPEPVPPESAPSPLTPTTPSDPQHEN